jgi:3-oxoacyl-[acyl-carrier protein] reductase
LVLPSDLKEKACLVTGASRGIGAAVARALGGCGSHVAIHYRTGLEEATGVARDIEKAGGRAVLLQGDIAERGAVDRIVAEAEAALGSLDILINNAGDLMARHPVTDTTDEFFDRQIATNIRPVFVACRAAVPLMRRQGGGVIVNVSSVAARTGGGGGSSLYASSKAFVATFTRALAKELAPDNIRVNAVSPGVIDTPMQDRTTPPEQLRAAMAQIPLRRVGTPEECAGAFLYLCSEELSRYVTGQIIEVNGGLVMP